MVGGQAFADDPELRALDVLHGGEQCGVALVADQAGDNDDGDCLRVRTEFGADAGAGRGVGVEAGRVAAVADADGARVDAPAPGHGGLLGGDGEIGVGKAAADPLDGEAQGAAPGGAGLVEKETVAGVGDVGHTAEPGREAGEESADWHVGVHQVRALGADEADQGAQRRPLGAGRETAGERQRLHTQAFGADVVEQRAGGADADDVVPLVAECAHERQQEVAERKIDVGDL